MEFGAEEDKLFTTGNHVIQAIFCADCRAKIGWKYVTIFYVTLWYVFKVVRVC